MNAYQDVRQINSNSAWQYLNPVLPYKVSLRTAFLDESTETFQNINELSEHQKALTLNCPLKDITRWNRCCFHF